MAKADRSVVYSVEPLADGMVELLAGMTVGEWAVSMVECWDDA